MCLRREEGLEALEDKNEIPQWKASRKFEMRSDIANGEFIFSASFLLITPQDYDDARGAIRLSIVLWRFHTHRGEGCMLYKNRVTIIFSNILKSLPTTLLPR